MQVRIPKALLADPIAEAIFEIRFSTKEPAAAGDLLPGMLFPQLRKQFGEVISLPISQLPRVVRSQDPNLTYHPTNALLGSGKRLAFGDRVATLSFQRPYPGWPHVRPVINDVILALSGTDLISAVERISLKYVNVLTIGKDGGDLSVLNVSLKLGSFDLQPAGKLLRAEVQHRGCINVIQVMTGASLTMVIPKQPPTTLSGLVLDVDTIRMGPFDDPWRQIPALVDEIHATEKEIFFGLLTDEAIERMRPLYTD